MKKIKKVNTKKKTFGVCMSLVAMSFMLLCACSNGADSAENKDRLNGQNAAGSEAESPVNTQGSAIEISIVSEKETETTVVATLAAVKTDSTMQGPGQEIPAGPGIAVETEGAGIVAPGASGGDIKTKNGYADKSEIGINSAWKYADFSVINSGKAIMYTAKTNRKDKIVAVNAGHGTKGGASQKTYSHPDKTGKVTGGTNANGAVMSMCVSSGMTFKDGTPEAKVTLKMAQILRDKLLNAGYDVLMIRDGEDVQLDNVGRTVIANNTADIHIALHWDGDGLDKIKGVFYMSVPDGLKNMEPVKTYWQQHERLGDALIKGLETEIEGIKVWNCSGHGQLDTDLTQTSYSTIPSVDIELGNQCSDHSDAMLNREADGILRGIDFFFSN
ncbi:MAG: N-acetylmuramoyl-L-alanine amidase [Eubacteriales bacterium]|nr:N-acetylmuramoyl-L-alanine amidase [Eubacteriales bacterium]